ncbi:lysis protein [Escherichia coli]|nr:lysis protein [Escherichia coli]
MNTFISRLSPLVMLLLALVAYHYYGEYQDASTRASDAEDKLKTASATIITLETRQRELAVIDAKHTKELADAQAENDILRRRLSVGGRVRVEGRCPPVPVDATTGGVGDGATVELSSVAGQNILDIRAGIISDQAKLKYLQDYIRAHHLVEEYSSEK